MRGQGQVRPPRRGGLSLAPFALFLALLCLGGCGGSASENTSTPATAASKATVVQAPKPKPAPEGNKASAAKRTTPTPAPGAPGDPSPGEKAPAPGVPLTPQGDNSIQSFGTEGEQSERQQAEADLQSYLNARARGDWAGACEAASKQFAEELAKLIEQAKAKPGAEKPKTCAQTLETLYGKAPGSTLQQAARIDQVLSFRIRDDGYAYLIFKDPQGEVKFIAMADEAGTWKVNVPEPAAFESTQGEAQ